MLFLQLLYNVNKHYNF